MAYKAFIGTYPISKYGNRNGVLSFVLNETENFISYKNLKRKILYIFIAIKIFSLVKYKNLFSFSI